ncbi:hypothetical protein [Shinella sp. HZN7]|jgi:predicted dehydrogenase|uniref:hypothetical protein n=1 Tax=Shinella sp. (strain HZN7) TaxID=879274 RepID=UPI0007DA67DF|nr:hypothetical protein [Shinella sp. HZN7]ANH05652.1 hypothetical protein shn_17515 [Shinella sp. HZN7]
MTSIGIGVIGAGVMGAEHARILAEAVCAIGTVGMAHPALATRQRTAFEFPPKPGSHNVV